VAEGKKLLESENYEKAENIFSEAIKADGESAEAAWGRGKARMGLVQYETALQDLSRAIELGKTQKVADEQMGKYLMDRGLSHYALAKFPEAISDFQATIDLNYQPGEAYAYLGASQGNSDQPVNAVSSLNEAIKLDPDNHFARSNRGYYNSLLGDNKTAIEDFSAAIRLQPDDKMSYLNRGYTYIGMGDYATAVRDFEKALEIDPEFHGAITYMGIALTNTGQPKEALTWLDKAVSQEPLNATLYYYRGHCPHQFRRCGRRLPGPQPCGRQR
jgi:tetratricopeptide (TPR) repeat protein